jgi:glyoxylase I family protein
MDPQESRSTSASQPGSPVLGLWGVRDQVKDVARSIEFYTRTLGFHLDQQHLPAFGQVSIQALKLVLSGPGASGSIELFEPSRSA